MSDYISRQAAIDALKEHRALFCDNTPDTFSKLSYAEKSRVDELDMAIATLINLPSAQQDCTECEEYDTERHYCPRYCDVIRETVEEVQPERKTGRWIPQKDKWSDYVTTVDGYVCSECNNFDCMEENYCPNCGARMEGES